MRTAPHAINIKKMQIVNCAEAKICHFPFLDLGGREVLSFPSILCKIEVHSCVAPGPKKMSLVPIHIPEWRRSLSSKAGTYRSKVGGVNYSAATTPTIKPMNINSAVMPGPKMPLMNLLLIWKLNPLAAVDFRFISAFLLV